MNHVVYVAMIADRHTDVEPHVFSTPGAAIAYARSEALAGARAPEDVDENYTPKGWLYHATYSSEGDCVWVIETTVNDSIARH